MKWSFISVASLCSYVYLYFDAFLHKSRSYQILKVEEETWWLKSRATWIKKGDGDTIFFHNYANRRRNINSIWELEIEEGKTAINSIELKIIVSSHFSSLFKDLGTANISTQLQLIKHYPRFLNPKESV